MSPDLENLITVDAKVQQDAEHGSVDLLHPFISAVANSGKVSRLKLKAGNEVGVSLSLDGNHLMFDFSAYSFIQSGAPEELRYQYRINDAQGRYSQTSATITLARDRHDQLSIAAASLTTDQPFDYAPASEPINTNNTDDSYETEDEISNLSTEKLYEEDEQMASAAPFSTDSDHEFDNIELDQSDNSIDEFTEPLAELSAKDSEQNESDDSLFELDEDELENISLASSDEDPALLAEEYEPVTLDKETHDIIDSGSDKGKPPSPEEQQDTLVLGDVDTNDFEASTEAITDSEQPESLIPDNDENSNNSNEKEADDNSVTFHFTPQSEDQEDEAEKPEDIEDSPEEDTTLDPFSYEELASELPPTEEADTAPDIDLDQIISEVDQAISEADRLMDSTLGINEGTDNSYSIELGLLDEAEEDSPEHALSDLIGNLPKDSKEDNDAEEDLEHLIERLPDESNNIDSYEKENETDSSDSSASNDVTAKSEPLFDQQMILDGTSSYIFDLIDFDPDRLGLSKIRIDELPTCGALLYNKEPAEAGQEVNTTELLTGRLSFNPDSSDDTPETTEFSYSICFGDQSFAALTSSNLSVTIDISANTEDSLVGSGDVVIVNSRNQQLTL